MTEVLSPPGHAYHTLEHADLSQAHHAQHLDAETERLSSIIKPSQQIPTEEEFAALGDLPLLDSDHNSIPFRSLFSSPRRRVLVLFVRHFFCGNCQEYLRTLSSTITPEDLAACAVPTEIVVIGCGQPDLIPFYREATSTRFSLYSDPTRELYLRLGMARTMAPGDRKPEYVRKSFLGVVVSSFTQGVTAGRNALKGGDFWQVGGEFLVEDGRVRRCHRMTTTRDHAEMAELKEWLGLEDAKARQGSGKEEEDEEEARIQKKSKRLSLVDFTRSFSAARRSSSGHPWSRRTSGSSTPDKRERAKADTED